MNESLPTQNGAIPISSRKMVRFTPNVPVEVALQCTDGVRVDGRYGDCVKYTLTDDRTMYVDPFVAERIKELAIQPGELFEICKRQAKKGNRKTIYWAVEHPAEAGTQLERDLCESLERAKSAGVKSQAAATAPVEITAPPPNPFYELGCSAPSNGSSNGHDARNGSPIIPTASGPSPDDSRPRVPDTQLAHALKTAIAAAADAEKFGKTLDYNIRFTTEDIRSMGITVLIGMQQRTAR